MKSQKSKVKSQKFNSMRGFSLMELIVYFTIFSIIGTLGLAVFNYAIKGRTVIREMTEVHTSTQRAMEQVIERVRFSQAVNGASSTLNLQMASSTINPTIFDLNSGAIRIKEGTGSATDITPSAVYVTDLSFTHVINPAPSSSSVQISITIGYTRNSAAKEGTEYTLRSTAMPLR